MIGLTAEFEVLSPQPPTTFQFGDSDLVGVAQGLPLPIITLNMPG